ncbi:MAG: dTDP-glucose 4,6-dehydratase [Candidatus Marinimicrobia bacterium]|nr:dTDP-glucose 4,6-dehydratase [Candidatus Neomarinimicrobiota bacterium]
MKLFITGGAGFIGSNFIIQQINETSNEILNFDKLTYAGNPENLAGVSDNKRYQFLQDDICSAQAVGKALVDFQPDAILNFAAETHVDRSIDGPSQFIQTNIVGTSVLLEEALKYFQNLPTAKKAVFRLLHVSTDEVFGSLGESGYFTEATPYDPSSPYSASKAASDHLVRAWQRSFGLPTLISNCSNNYGPFQFPEKLIPLMIIKALAEQPLPVYGQGLNVRDWLFVGDHCEAVYTVLTQGEVGETYNIGGNNEQQNIDIVKAICSILNELRPRSKGQSYQELITFVSDRPGHDLRYAIDATKISTQLGWEPKVSFNDGLHLTIDWYLENLDWVKNIQNKTYRQERLGVLKS